jgi:hypothetical protein
MSPAFTKSPSVPGNRFGIMEPGSLADFRGYRLNAEEANSRIKSMLAGSTPFMVGRFGSGELRAVWRWRVRREKPLLEKLFREIVRKEKVFFTRSREESLERVAGFFPLNRGSVHDFSRLMVEMMPKVDLLGSWVRGENYFHEELAGVAVTDLEGLEPFFVSNPWSRALEGKRVLVIHPFADSIGRQYTQRRKIFPDLEILPEMDLDIIRAVQTGGWNHAGLSNWFEGLKLMTEQALSRDFDVALVGCGAYGFPLSAMLKREGRSAIHLGGALQLLFGIKGARWEEQRPELNKYYNAHWIRPLPGDTPNNFEHMERGAYW